MTRDATPHSSRGPIWRRPVWIVPLVLAFIGAGSMVLEAVRDDGGSGDGLAKTIGAEEVVFSAPRDACEPIDLADNPIHAFRNADNQVVAIASHYVVRAFVGPTLDRLARSCSVIFRSKSDPLPENFSDKGWIHSTYTPDGRTVYGIVSNEYHGWEHPGRCAFAGQERFEQRAQQARCWYNAQTLAVSKDGGRTFTQAPPPHHLIASLPYPYTAGDGPYGIFSPTSIVLRREDGYYYMMVRAEPYKAQQHGVCLMRTRNLADPRSWRAWDGSGFTTEFINPYVVHPPKPEDHVCTPVAPRQIGGMSYSLTYNTYLGKYLLIGNARNEHGPPRWGFYYSLSDDLIHWTDRRLLKRAEFPWTYECGDPETTLYASAVDPDSPSRNFETTDSDFYLYFSRSHYQNCMLTLNRDLVRIRVQISR